MGLLNRNRIVNLMVQIDNVTRLDDHGLLESQLNRMKSLLLDIGTQLSYGQTAPIQTFINVFERMENEVRLARLLIRKVLDQQDSRQQRRFVREFYKKLREDTEAKELRSAILLISEILDQQDSWPSYCILCNRDVYEFYKELKELKELMLFEKLREHTKLIEKAELQGNKLLKDLKELKEDKLVKDLEELKEHTELRQLTHLTHLTELEELKPLNRPKQLKRLEYYTEVTGLNELKKLIRLIIEIENYTELKKNTEHTDLKELIQLIIKWKENVDELYKELKKLTEHTEVTELVQTGPKNGEVFVESWLRETPDLPIIGVCGGAGVGKTRLLQNVYNSYKVSDFFDVVIWVTVGQLDIPELQDCIARTVNLDLAADHHSINLDPGADHSIDLDMRKIKLSEYLKAKKFLLVFDDISIPLDLKKLGVEFGYDKGSKIICSSRTKDVIEKSWAKHGIYIEPLTREEAWELLCNVAFKDSHLPQDSQHIARNVADECRGLPLAIHVVAATMRGNTSGNDWNLALAQMQTTASDHKFPTSHLSIDDHLYQILRWSYERLPDSNFKSCFLYCAMFPRDEEIEAQKMMGMWIAEGFVKSMDSAHSYIKLLEDRCFFQVTRVPHGKVYIKTYNPLRDLAMYIGKSEEHCLFMAGGQVQNFLFLADRQVDNFPGEIERNDWKRITFYGNNIKYIPAQRLNCRNLVSLILGANKGLEEVSMSFLEQLPYIKVLDMSRTNIKFLPITLWSRKHLEYLDLSYTQIEYLSEYIGCLSELQFLNLSGCSKLESLPEAIGHLSKLQFLNLYGCSKLTSIPSVIYDLKSLKHLYISQYNILL